MEKDALDASTKETHQDEQPAAPLNQEANHQPPHETHQTEPHPQNDDLQEDEGQTKEDGGADPDDNIHYTLESISEDIDQFLITLSFHTTPDKDATSKEAEDENDATDHTGEHVRSDGTDEEAEDGKTDDTEKGGDSAESSVVEASLEIPDFVEQFLALVEAKIAKYDSTYEETAKWCHKPEEDKSFLEAVSRVTKLTTLLSRSKLDEKNGKLLNQISSIQQQAMAHLEDQFRALLRGHKSPGSEPGNGNSKQDSDPSKTKQEEEEGVVPSESASQHDKYPQLDFLGYPQEVLSSMNLLVKEMISCGYEIECCHIYAVSRRRTFEQSINKIGFERFCIDEVQKVQWESLEREITNWNETFRQCATSSFSVERKLAEAIFCGYPSLSSNLFINLTGSIFIHLLNFVEAVAMTKCSAEKLFKILDIYETLCSSSPNIDELFSDGERETDLKTEMATSRNRLGEAAICMFCNLENSIKSETGRVPVPGGAVHPLARYVMNYLKYAYDYKDTLEIVFKKHSKIERADSTSRPHFKGEDQNYSNHNNNNNASGNQSPFCMQLMKVMDMLDANLEAKSKLYKDVSLSNIFLMNNGRYILQKIKGSKDFNNMMGDTWGRKRSSELRQYHRNYQRETWNKILQCISNNEGLISHGKIVKPNLKEKFKSFNAMFEEIHRTQSQWVVNDEQLQSELRVSISSLMIPAYRSFLARFSQYLDPGRQTEKYIKYQPEDIETYIEELFDGNVSANRK